MRGFRWALTTGLVGSIACLPVGLPAVTPPAHARLAAFRTADGPAGQARPAALPGRRACARIQTITGPAGLRPLTASPAQLAAAGLPPRPPAADRGALAAWTTAMARLRPDTQPACALPLRQHLSTLPRPEVNQTFYSYNWAAHVVPDADYGRRKFTAVVSEWIQPKVPGDRHYGCTAKACYAPAAAEWAGFDNGKSLIQAGCDSASFKKARYYCWYEDYPQFAHVVSAPAVRPGNTVYVYVRYLGNKHSEFFIENVTTGKHKTYRPRTPYVGQTNADFVVERAINVKGQPRGWYLPEFRSVKFLASSMFQGSTENELTRGKNDPWVLVDGCSRRDKVLATPGNVVSNDQFTVTWKASRPWINKC